MSYSPDSSPIYKPASEPVRREAYAPVVRGKVSPVAQPQPTSATLGELVAKSTVFRMALVVLAGGLLALQFAPKTLAQRLLEQVPENAIPKDMNVDQLIERGNRVLDKVIEEEKKGR